MRTPACSMETAAGAAAWPPGLHEWSGHIGTRTAKPRKITGNHASWNPRAKPSPARANSSIRTMSNVRTGIWK